MTRFVLLAPCVMEADAVGNDVLGMHRELVERGFRVDVAAENWNVSQPRVRNYRGIGRLMRQRSNVLVYHHSIGWDEGLKIVRQARCRKVIKYHNVTPPEFFDRLHAGCAHDCRRGREQVAGLAAARCSRYLSDSEYNLAELLDAGIERALGDVVPPFHHIDRLAATVADRDVLARYADGPTNVLTVGRLAPNKGHMGLLDAFAFYHHRYNTNSRLLIVGKPDDRLSAYTQALKARTASLRLSRAVVFTGGVTTSELAAYYRVADVFMTTSLHEGFCVPLVEAMAMRVPIVALGAAAVAGTAGGAALVWEDSSADIFAASIHAIVSDERLRAALVSLAASRYEAHYTNERIGERFIDSLASV